MGSRLSRSCRSCALVGALLSAPTTATAQSPPAKVFNPDISVIGNAHAWVGHNAVDPQPSIELHESELGLQAIVDPYARADFFLTFGSEKGDVGVEEGYLTFLNLPWDLLVKAGRMKGAFGK